MSQPTAAQIRAELTADPLGHYAPFLAAGDFVGLEVFFNDPASPGTGPITLSVLARDPFLKAIMPAVLAVANKDQITQDKWDRILAVVRAVDWITNDASNQAIINMMVTDGLLTPDQANAVFTRAGSLAEIRWGPGTILNHTQLATAWSGVS